MSYTYIYIAKVLHVRLQHGTEQARDARQLVHVAQVHQRHPRPRHLQHLQQRQDTIAGRVKSLQRIAMLAEASRAAHGLHWKVYLSSSVLACCIRSRQDHQGM